MGKGFQDYDGRVISWSAGVDWYSGTLKGDSDKRADLFCRAKDALRATLLADEEPKTGSMYKYHMERGDGVQHGYDWEANQIVVLSGSRADEFFYKIAPLCEKTTRIDLRLDIMMDSDIQSSCIVSAEREVEYAMQCGATLTKRYNPMGNDREGRTLYVGSRAKSQSFVRVYDKWRKSGEEEYKNVLRLEVEFKEETALQITKLLLETPFGETESRIAATVLDYCRRRGMMLMGLNLDGIPFRPIVSRTRKDLHKTLEWLERAVRPSVRRLIEAGVTPERIKACLGLSRY